MQDNLPRGPGCVVKSKLTKFRNKNHLTGSEHRTRLILEENFLELVIYTEEAKKSKFFPLAHSISDRSSDLLSPFTVNTTQNIKLSSEKLHHIFCTKKKNWLWFEQKNKNTDKVIKCFTPLVLASHFVFYFVPLVKASRMVETTQFHYPVVFQILQFLA